MRREDRPVRLTDPRRAFLTAGWVLRGGRVRSGPGAQRQGVRGAC